MFKGCNIVVIDKWIEMLVVVDKMLRVEKMLKEVVIKMSDVRYEIELW